MVNRMNKRGWIRIVEAMIAIMIIIGIVLTFSARKTGNEKTDLTPLITPLLDEIAQNPSLRNAVLDSNATVIESMVAERITNPAFGYGVKICGIGELCGLTSYPGGAQGDIYTSERVIAATPEKYQPMKVKIFLWRKS